MVWTKFELDEQKAQELSGMSIDEIYTQIDEIAKDCNLIKKGKGFYENNEGKDTDLGYLATFIFTEMSHKEWFVKSAKTWTMYDESDGEGSVFDIE